MKTFYFPETFFERLSDLRQMIPQIYSYFGIKEKQDLNVWLSLLDKKLMPRFNPDFPLIAAICGGGSSGKSTLFNSLSKNTISPSGGRAGMNRRVLIAAHSDFMKDNTFLSTLYGPFQCRPKILIEKEELLTTGDPLYVINDTIPKKLVLLDTPDFDTGARGSYSNRLMAEHSLETADIFIYIFTNSNYNNRDNTDFMRRILSGAGKRKVILLYRAYPSYSDEDVMSHSMTVAHNIYGSDAEKYILGIYRADEDNAVAAGEKWVRIRSVRTSDSQLDENLNAIDKFEIRKELLKSALEDFIIKTEDIIEEISAHKEWLDVYISALKSVQIKCMQEALSHFPMDLVMKKFAEVWLTTDPRHIKILRKTGRFVETPMRWIMKSFDWIKHPSQSSHQPVKELESFTRDLKMDLLHAANQMYRGVVDSKISMTLSSIESRCEEMRNSIQNISVMEKLKPYQFFAHISNNEETQAFDFSIPASPALHEVRENIRKRNWQLSLDNILSKKELLTDITKNIEDELIHLAVTFRNKMNFFDQIQQTFLAVLNVLPATAAITYILTTGDPIGGAGVKVKLTGLFGLQDLYALVAIPATAGLKKADLHQLEMMLGPIAKSWLDDKLKTVQSILDAEITGEIFDTALDIQSKTATTLLLIEENMEHLKRMSIK